MTDPPPPAYTIESRSYEHYSTQPSAETDCGKDALSVFAVIDSASGWTNHGVCDDPFRSSPIPISPFVPHTHTHLPLLNPMGTIPGPLSVALYQPLTALNASGDSPGDSGPVFGTLGVNGALAATALLPLSVNLTAAAQGKPNLWEQYPRVSYANGARVISPPTLSESESRLNEQGRQANEALGLWEGDGLAVVFLVVVVVAGVITVLAGMFVLFWACLASLLLFCFKSV